jgi:hypothetical protein
MKKTIFTALVAMTAMVASDASACGSHGCGPVGGVGVGVNVRVNVRVNVTPQWGYGYGYGGGFGQCGWWGCGGWGGACGGFYGGCGFYGPWFGPRPFFGAGAMAFRRSWRLGMRAQRAASLGFFGRANRLQARSDAAFARGQARFARFF